MDTASEGGMTILNVHLAVLVVWMNVEKLKSAPCGSGLIVFPFIDNTCASLFVVERCPSFSVEVHQKRSHTEISCVIKSSRCCF